MAIEDTPKPDPNEPTEPELEELRKAIGDARIRLKRLARSDTLTAQAVALELCSTILPLMGEQVDFIDRLEEHAEYVGDRLAAMEGESSQLIAEDADKFEGYIEAVHQVVDASLAQMDPTSQAADSLRKLKELGDDLLESIDEMRIEDDPDETPQPAPPAPPGREN